MKTQPSYDIDYLCNEELTERPEKMYNTLPIYFEDKKIDDPTNFKLPDWFSSLPIARIDHIKHMENETLIYLFYYSSNKSLKKMSKQELEQRGYTYNLEINVWLKKSKNLIFDITSWKFYEIDNEIMKFIY